MMKTSVKKSVVIAAVLGAQSFGNFILVQAQETTTSTSSSSDSIVALAADSQSLRQIAPSDTPGIGATYWWVYPGGLAVPSPMLPLDVSPQIFGVTSSEFLVDLTGGAVVVTPFQLEQAAQATTNAYAVAVTAQVQGLIDLIQQVQAAAATTTTAATTMTASAKPMDGGGGFSPMDQTQGGFPYLTIAATGTNAFSITVFNTNSATYYLQMTPVLANTNYPWQIIANGTVGETNFTVNNGPYENEFFRVLMATNNPGQGIAVFIDSPANGATVQ